MKPNTPFTPSGAESAYRNWKANCGPAAAAAVLIANLENVRPFFPHFPKRNYTTPKDMEHALLSGRASLQVIEDNWPDEYGVTLVQFKIPGKPLSNRFSHWVGFLRIGHDEPLIYDVNWFAGRGDWRRRREWAEKLMPWLYGECGARGFEVKRSYEVELSR